MSEINKLTFIPFRPKEILTVYFSSYAIANMLLFMYNKQG